MEIPGCDSPSSNYVDSVFSLSGKVAVVVGASGAIGTAVSRALGSAGATVACLARRREPLEALAARLQSEEMEAAAWPVDVLDQRALELVRDSILERFAHVEILVNVAGGNLKAATLADEDDPFTLPAHALRDVVELNLLGPLAAIRVFGPSLAASAASDRSIVNFSSMAASRALTRVSGYGAAKAALESATRCFAVELARRQLPIRVNAVAPGFLVGEQNRRLLLDEDGTLTSRGRTIIDHTPLGRFGGADEVASVVVWLSGPGARFVTGAVVPVDGGFGAFSGV